MKALLVLGLLGGIRAQQFEVGVMGGGGFLNGVTVGGGRAAATAGFSPGPVAGILFAHNRYSRWSGEIRYLWEQRDPRLTSGPVTAGFSGQAHAMQYNMLFHTRSRKGRLEPYVTLGAGFKIFRGTGAETAYRPLMEYAYLTRTTESKPMLAIGGGLKVRFRGRLAARFDFQNQITGIPRRVISPAPGMSIGGWLWDFIPTVGLNWIF